MLVCLHGFGDEGQSYLPFAMPLRTLLNTQRTDIALSCAAPNGLSGTPSGQGYQWFRDAGWTFRDEKGLQKAAEWLEDFLQNLEAETSIPRERTAILGFSQGAMTLLHALPSLSTPPACALSLSGALTVQPTVLGTKPTCPLLFTHGTEDDVLPADRTIEAAAFFEQHGYPVETHLVPDLGHGIDITTLGHITTFLAAHLPPA